MNDLSPLSVDVTALVPHPAADAFPLLVGKQLEALRDDIKANGLLEPIEVASIDGRWVLIDGRNRLAACRMAGVEPTPKILDPNTDWKARIVAKNATRRHMSQGQRAMALAMIYPEPTKGGRGKKGASDLHGINHTSLSQARFVLRYQRQLAERVRDGSIELDPAYKQAKDASVDDATKIVRFLNFLADDAHLLRNPQAMADAKRELALLAGDTLKRARAEMPTAMTALENAIRAA
jgi:hypothetical protein